MGLPLPPCRRFAPESATLVDLKAHTARVKYTARLSREGGVVGAAMSSKITKRMMSSVDDMVSRASSATKRVSSHSMMFVPQHRSILVGLLPSLTVCGSV